MVAYRFLPNGRKKKVNYMLLVETEREIDGRWLAEITELPGVICYGANREEAVARAKRWRCVSWPTVSTTVKRFPTCRPLFSAA